MKTQSEIIPIAAQHQGETNQELRCALFMRQQVPNHAIGGAYMWTELHLRYVMRIAYQLPKYKTLHLHA